MRGMNLEEDRGVLLEDFAVGARGDIVGGRECVENDARALEAARADALEREKGVVNAAEAVCDDEHDRQGKAGGEVGDGCFGRYGNEPTAGTLDKEGGVFAGEVAEPVYKSVERKGAVFESGGDERCGGLAEPDGVGFVEGQAMV